MLEERHFLLFRPLVCVENATEEFIAIILNEFLVEVWVCCQLDKLCPELHDNIHRIFQVLKVLPDTEDAGKFRTCNIFIRF